MIKKYIFVIFFSLLFYVCSAEDYYWIRGEGYWTDLRHWAKTSGGTQLHTKLPNKTDNVFFDENSFFRDDEYVYLTEAVCQNMDFSKINKNVNLYTSRNISIYIHGSLILSDKLSFSNPFDVTFIFKSTGNNNIIDTKGTGFPAHMTFFMTGRYKLENDLSVQSVKILSGNLNTNNKQINVEKKFSIEGADAKTVSLQTSKISTGEWAIEENSNLTLNAGAFEISATVFKSPAFNYHNVELKASMYGELLFLVKNASFKEIKFSNSGYIEGDFTVNDLLFSPVAYEIKANSKITIKNSLNTLTDCKGSVYLSSSSQTEQVTFISSKQIVLEYVTLQGIQGTGGGGGGNFTANNSQDLGNNTGWTISEKVGATYYWIGEIGSKWWNQERHWSTTSGGTTPAGCIPSFNDTAIFDANSFEPGVYTGNDMAILNYSEESFFIKNIDFSQLDKNIKISSSPKTNLFIGESLILSNRITNEFRGKFITRGNNSGTITSNGVPIHFLELRHQGEWEISDELEVEKLDIYSGTFNSKGKNIKIENLQVLGTGSKDLKLANSLLTVTNAEIIDPKNLIISSYPTSIVIPDKNSRFVINNTAAVNLSFPEIILEAGNSTSYFSTNGVVIDNLEFGRSSTIQTTHAEDITFKKGKFNIEKEIKVDGNLKADGTCEAPITIESKDENNKGKISKESGGNVVVSNVYLYNIEATSTSGISFTADKSIDGGKNKGWSFTNSANERKLYWVNDGGNWENPNHWALTSGGTAGECIPTPYDDVIFDENSFSKNNQKVLINETAYAKNMAVEASVSNLPILESKNRNVELNIHGSFTLNKKMRFKFSGILHFQTAKKRMGEKEITWSQDIYADEIIFDGDENTHWKFMDDLYIYISSLSKGNLKFHSGHLKSNSKMVTVNRFLIHPSANSNFQNTSIQLGASIVRIYSYLNNEDPNGWELIGNLIDFQAMQSSIEFYNTNKMLTTNKYKYNNVISHNPLIIENKSGQVIDIAHLQFLDNGTILGNHIFETLSFSRMGAYYRFEANSKQVINNEWEINSDICHFTTIKSTQLGVQAIVEKTGSIVDGKYLIIEDNRVGGGAIFYSGNNSTLGSNVSGWTNTDSPKPPAEPFTTNYEVYKCAEETEEVLVNEIYNTKTPYNDFLWNDGQITASITINKYDEYYVDITKLDGCIERTKFIVAKTPIKRLQTEVIKFCNETVLFVKEYPGSITEYLWSDGSNQATLNINSENIYIVNMTLNDKCEYVKDFVAQRKNIDATISSSTNILCGDKFPIELIVEASSTTEKEFTYQWKTGETTPVIEVSQENVYEVLVTSENDCAITLEKEILKKPELKILQPPKAFGCKDDEFIYLDASTNDMSNTISYQWDNGETTPKITVSQESTYSVTVETTYCGILEQDFETSFIICDVKPTNFITPNSDNINDFWEIQNSELFFVDVKIFSRWGNLLYEKNNYQNEWSGTINNKPLPKGSYYYSLKARHKNIIEFEPIEKKGIIVIMY